MGVPHLGIPRRLRHGPTWSDMPEPLHLMNRLSSVEMEHDKGGFARCGEASAASAAAAKPRQGLG